MSALKGVWAISQAASRRQKSVYLLLGSSIEELVKDSFQSLYPIQLPVNISTSMIHVHGI